MKTLNKLNQILKPTKTMSLSALAMVFIVACANDKDYNAFRQGQEQDQQAKAAVANGTYNGVVTSKMDGLSLGNMSLQITASSVLQNSQDNLGTEKRAVMIGQLNYSGLSNSFVPISQGFYDTDTGEFQAAVNVTDETGVVQPLMIDGFISGGTFKGDVYNQNYDKSYGGHMSLTSGASLSQASVDSRSARATQLAGDNSVFQGQYSYPANPTVKNTLTLQLSSTALQPQQKFSHLFTPVRYVNISIDLGIKSQPFANAVNNPATIDDTDNQLTGLGQYSSNGNTYIINVTCNRVPVNQKEGWSCKLVQGVKTVTVTVAPVSAESITN
jgi:hypothetical protein